MVYENLESANGDRITEIGDNENLTPCEKLNRYIESELVIAIEYSKIADELKSVDTGYTQILKDIAKEEICHAEHIMCILIDMNKLSNEDNINNLLDEAKSVVYNLK